MINGMLFYRQNGVQFTRVNPYCTWQKSSWQVPVTGCTQKDYPQAFHALFFSWKNTFKVQQLVTFGEYLVEVSIFKCVWYSREGILKQPTEELNIGVRWGQVLHSHWIKCFCPCAKTECARRWVSYRLGFALSYWFLPSRSYRGLHESAEEKTVLRWKLDLLLLAQV